EPVMSVAIEPRSKADEDNLQKAMAKLSEEDPTFHVRMNDETGQTLIQGMGELHLEILVERMRREFGVEANVGKPQVAYRETIMDVEVVVPKDYLGDVLGDLNAKRGRIVGMFVRSEAQVIAALVPLSEMFGYVNRLRSLTQGRGVFTMQFSRYEPLPEALESQL